MAANFSNRGQTIEALAAGLAQLVAGCPTTARFRQTWDTTTLSQPRQPVSLAQAIYLL
jgi:hypothetical protein